MVVYECMLRHTYIYAWRGSHGREVDGRFALLKSHKKFKHNEMANYTHFKKEKRKVSFLTFTDSNKKNAE